LVRRSSKGGSLSGVHGPALGQGVKFPEAKSFLVLVHPIKVGRLAPFLTDPYPSLKKLTGYASVPATPSGESGVDMTVHPITPWRRHCR